jgi:hypothetical protein
MELREKQSEVLAAAEKAALDWRTGLTEAPENTSMAELFAAVEAMQIDRVDSQWLAKYSATPPQGTALHDGHGYLKASAYCSGPQGHHCWHGRREKEGEQCCHCGGVRDSFHGRYLP